MATLISVQHPPIAPTLDSIDTSIGTGTWASGTYDFVTFASSAATFPCKYSGPSNKLTKNVSTNDKLIFKWTHNDASVQNQNVGILYSKNSGPWYSINYLQASTGYVATAPQYAAFDSITHNYVLNASTNNVKYLGLANDRGCGIITINGSGNFTTLDINNALIAANASEGLDFFNYGDNGFVGNYCLDMRAYGTGRFTLSDNYIHAIGGISNAGSGLVLYSRHASFKPMTSFDCITWSIGTSPINSYQLANCDLENVVFKPYLDVPRTNVISTASTPLSGRLDKVVYNQMAPTGLHLMKNSFIEGSQPLFTANASSMDDLTIIFDQAGWTSAAGAKANRIKFICSNYMSIRQGDTIDLTDCQIYYPTPTTRFHFDNFINFATSRLYRYTGTATSDIRSWNSVNFTVTDSLGAAVPTPHFKCVDVSGTTIFDVDGSVGGTLATVIMTAHSQAKNPCTEGMNAAVRADNYFYNPFTFTISKTGYQTVTSTQTITDPVTIPITLLADVQSGTVYVNQYIDGSICSASLSGNIYTNSIQGSVSQNNVEGIVSSISLSSNISAAGLSATLNI